MQTISRGEERRQRRAEAKEDVGGVETERYEGQEGRGYIH